MDEWVEGMHVSAHARVTVAVKHDSEGLQLGARLSERRDGGENECDDFAELPSMTVRQVVNQAACEGRKIPTRHLCSGVETSHREYID